MPPKANMESYKKKDNFYSSTILNKDKKLKKTNTNNFYKQLHGEQTFRSVRKKNRSLS